MAVAVQMDDVGAADLLRRPCRETPRKERLQRIGEAVREVLEVECADALDVDRGGVDTDAGVPVVRVGRDDRDLVPEPAEAAGDLVDDPRDAAVGPRRVVERGHMDDVHALASEKRLPPLSIAIKLRWSLHYTRWKTQAQHTAGGGRHRPRWWPWPPGSSTSTRSERRFTTTTTRRS